MPPKCQFWGSQVDFCLASWGLVKPWDTCHHALSEISPLVLDRFLSQEVHNKVCKNNYYEKTLKAELQVHPSSERKLRGGSALLHALLPMCLAIAELDFSVSWRISFSPIRLSLANSTTYFRCRLDLWWGLLNPQWRVNTPVMCFNPLCTLTATDLTIYLVLVFLVRWWALWGQGLYLFLFSSLEHQCPAMTWPNTKYLFPDWVEP